MDDSRVGIQGFIPEFLKHLKKLMEEELGHDFSYELELVSDGDYGRYDIDSHSWSGLMGRLVNGVCIILLFVCVSQFLFICCHLANVA